MGSPAFRIKQDVLPGSFTTQWFTATKPGEYHLFCQEYCGTDHSKMGGRVVVMEEKDYQAWLAGVASDEPPAISGARLFATYGCNQCHGQNAPTLAGLYNSKVQLDDGTTVIADEEYLRTSITNPAAQIVAGYGRLMPSYRGQLNEQQLNDLIAYMRSLASAQGTPGSARTDVAAPASRPSNDVTTKDIPNIPPSRQPPSPRTAPPGEVP